MTTSSLNRDWLAAIACLFFALFTAPLAQAQGVLVDVRPGVAVRLPRPIPVPHPTPDPPASYKIDSLEVDAKLSDQVARVQTSQTFENTGSATLQASFVFPLPYDGAIDQLTLMVDGKEYDAKLLSKEEARKRYEEIVRKNQDPALLEWVGTGMFQTSVFPIPPGEKRTVTLRYSQLCRRNHGLTDFLFPLATAKYTSGPIARFKLRIAIESTGPIKNVYSATHDAKVERSDEKHAVVTVEASDTVPSEDFRLFFDSGESAAQASLVSYRPDTDEDGYFLLLASPEVKSNDEKTLPKTVMFVVDRSGSMSGEKIEQAREAAKFVLNNLKEGDLFNIIAYDSAVEAFRPELQKFDDDTRKAALGFVDGLYAGGGTNIDGALKQALAMLNDDDRPTYVLFLTDGLPTVGETGEGQIVKHSEEENDVRARIFAFGVGYDVNSRLLDRLARANFGLSQYVRPDEDIEQSVSALYRKIGAPVLTDVEVGFELDGNDEEKLVTRVYPKGKFDLFAGDQAVLVGRYRKSGDAKLTLTGKVGGEVRSFDFPAKFVKKSEDDANAFVAKLWATRRVGEIIDEIDLKGRNEELVNELVALATKHGIITPYTSFLADETSSFRDLERLSEAAKVQLDSLHETSGRRAFEQRGGKLALQTASRAGAVETQMDRFGGYGGRGIGVPTSAPADAGLSAASNPPADRAKVAQNVRRIGRKTFFQRGDRWIDSDVSEEEESKARKIERYSEEQFALADRYGKHVNQYLAFDEPIVIKLGDEVFKW